MNNKEIVKNSKIIKVYGNKATIEKAIKFLEQLNLNGNEDNDRLLIQECIDNNKLGARISYEGKTIYSFNKIVKMYKSLQKDGTLENLNNDMYDFLMNACEDIAHYDLSGYKIHYDNSWEKLEKELLLNPHLTSRYSDINKIFKELNIGEYYTDMKMYRIGEDVEFENGWDTPTLRECWRTAPYLFNGRAATMMDVFEVHRHGIDKKVSRKDLEALSEYVNSL